MAVSSSVYIQAGSLFDSEHYYIYITISESEEYIYPSVSIYMPGEHVKYKVISCVLSGLMQTRSMASIIETVVEIAFWK